MAAIKFTCPQCSQPLDAPEEASGATLPCPACGVEIQMPAAATTRGGKVCGVCLSPINDSEAKTSCPACHVEYHTECWQENGGCAVYGCPQVPVIEKRSAIEIPMSYWGRENKQCPSCKKEILAAAVRCRHCGATFETARPQDTDEFQRHVDLTQRLPKLRRTVIWLFVFSVIPCLAPIGAVWGLIWYPTHREDVRALPALYGALCKIGIGVGIAQTVAVVLMAVLFSVVRK